MNVAKRHLKKKKETQKAHRFKPDSRWHGSDEKVYFKPGANASLTYWGREAICELHDAGLSPLRIAVRLGISNIKVQQILHDLRDREPDFDFQTYQALGNFRQAF